MRALLWIGVLAAIAAVARMAPACADDAPPAVFPVTTETDLAGYNGPSLNGAAPGSVQVNLGGRTFAALYFQNQFLKDTPGWANAPQPQFMSFFFLYPGFDYGSPSGVHFGAQAEIRATSATQGGGIGYNTNSPVPYFHQAWSYVSSPAFGKLQFGMTSGALVQNAVGTSDDFGTGVFFSWYNSGIIWVMADAPDNFVTDQKVTYTTPYFDGFHAAVSWQPTPVSLNYANDLTQNQPPGATGLLSKDRVELAARYDGAFGMVGVRANLGYVFSGAENAGGTKVAQSVSYGNAGVQALIAGFELEGSVNSGRFNVAPVDNGNPDGPLPIGARGSTAVALGAGYGAGPVKVGAVYYAVSYDEGDLGGTMGRTGRINGEGFGAGYTVGPGVVIYLDATVASIDEMNYTATAFGRQHPMSLGLGAFLTW